MSESMIIGVDHGYAAMKTAHFSFPSGLVAYEHEPYTLKDVLEYGGKFYVVGSGRQALQKNKTQTEDYYLLTLAAIAKELSFRHAEPATEIHLAAGLPLTSFGREKNAFRDYLLRDVKTVNFRYEGQEYSIAIRKVSLFPQGYAAVLTQSILLDEPSVIVADIGGWTVDLMRMDNRSERFVYRIIDSDEQHDITSEIDVPGQCAAVWNGEPKVIANLLTGEHAIPIEWRCMQLKDGIDFAEFLVDVTCKIHRFQTGIGTCGGPIDTLLITKDYSKWIKHKILAP